VLLDLSHELDYTNWIVGQLVNIRSFQTKISNLEIDSDDLVSLMATTKKGVVVNLSIDYFSKLAHDEGLKLMDQIQKIQDENNE
jgi:hypothetical protein